MDFPVLYIDYRASFAEELAKLSLVHDFSLPTSTTILALHDMILEMLESSPHRYRLTRPVYHSTHPHENAAMKILAYRNQGTRYPSHNNDRLLQPVAFQEDSKILDLVFDAKNYGNIKYSVAQNRFIVHFSTSFVYSILICYLHGAVISCSAETNINVYWQSTKFRSAPSYVCGRCSIQALAF